MTDLRGLEKLMSVLPAAALRSLAACCALMLAGCATTGAKNPADPWEGANREVYEFNHAIDEATLKPIAEEYHDHVPKWMRTSVSNFFDNLDTPITIVNEVLQGKFKEAGQDTLRFAMNTTLGIGGLFDPAGDAELPRHDEDLGQTLGVWGVPPGPYVMLPLLGPSQLRDIPSHVFDRFLEPFYWYNYGAERWGSLGLSLVEKRESLLPLDDTLEHTYDPYAFIRNAYGQRRLYQVYDGDVPEDKLPKEEPIEDESDTPEDEPAPGEPPAAEEQPGPGSQAD